MFKKLKLNFIIMNMLIISLLVLGAFSVIFSMTQRNIENENQRKLDNLILGPTTSLLQYPDLDIQMNNVPTDYILSFSILLDSNNQVINIQSFLDLPFSLIQDATRKALDYNEPLGKIDSNGKTWMYKIQETGSLSFMGSGYVHNTRQISFLDISDSQQVLSQLLMSLILIGAFMMFLILGISVFFSRRAVAPVEAAYLAQKKFLEDASHELKTPIAAVIANAEVVLANEEETVGSQMQWLNHIKDESSRMSDLVNGLLYLSKSDYEPISINKVEFNYSKAVNDLVLSVEAIIYEKGLSLNSKVDSDIFLLSDMSRVNQIIRILIDNAIKYADDGGGLEIDLSKQNEFQTILKVSNTGLGIPAEHIDKIFDRFYRVNEARTGDGSYGIGLSIASILVHQLEGNLSVESIEGEITTFTLKL